MPIEIPSTSKDIGTKEVEVELDDEWKQATKRRIEDEFKDIVDNVKESYQKLLRGRRHSIAALGQILNEQDQAMDEARRSMAEKFAKEVDNERERRRRAAAVAINPPVEDDWVIVPRAFNTEGSEALPEQLIPDDSSIVTLITEPPAAVACEPDEGWKKDLGERVDEGVLSIVRETEGTLNYKLLRRYALSGMHPLEKQEFRGVENELNLVRGLAVEVTEEQLERERQTRRWSVDGVLDPAWQDTLVKEQIGILNSIRENDEQVAILNSFKDAASKAEQEEKHESCGSSMQMTDDDLEYIDAETIAEELTAASYQLQDPRTSSKESRDTLI